MTTQEISLEQLAEKIGGKLWIKGDLKRIYLDRGYNTKKMGTKTYVYKSEDGEFKVSCNIDCSSQDYNWIKSQQQQVIDSVMEDIERSLFEIENPEADYDAHLEALEIKKEAAQEAKWLSEKEKNQKEIAELSLDNVGGFIKNNVVMHQLKCGTTLWDIWYNNFQLQTQSRFLNEKDEYPPAICHFMFERVFLKSEKHADETFTDSIGIIKVGDASVEFDDVLEFEHIRTQGKNGPNKKNVFAPKLIPHHISDKLSEVLEQEKVKRIQHLKNQVEYHTQQLISCIEKYKAENAN